MKVLHLIGGGDIGGAKIHVLSLVKALSKSVDVKIISYRPGVFTDEGLGMGIDIEVIKTGNIFRDIRMTMDVARQGGYEIIHSHGAKANMISALISGSLRLPTVTTVHSDYKLDYLHNLFKQLSFGLINTVALRFINYHIGVSNNFRKMLINRGFNPDHIFTVYNGIDFTKEIPPVDKGTFLNKYGVPVDNSILVGILARLHPVKGVGTFIKAAAKVLKKHNNVRFLIAGDGSEKNKLEKKVSALGAAGRVHFLGFVNEPDDFMNIIDINVLTSLSESFPYVILQGARARKPTISTDVGGISDLIVHGENGFLFDAGNSDRLADYIEQLIVDSTLRKDFGERIYADAKKSFSLENMYRAQLEIYNSILSGRDNVG